MVVISVSLSGKELKEFDEIIKTLKYSSRSDAVRDALHKFVVQNKWLHQIEGDAHFLISVVYDEKKKHSVLDVIHNFNDVIHSSTHTHFDNKCAEQLVLIGDAKKIRDMIEQFASLKDVRVCNCSV
ncbi:MAG: ribbon-helix-helix protein, CopG family [Thermoplasmatales archaeon]|nr:ribbon-helix-helix protein, CopG family [Thermoplasmatales archaeon]